MLHQNRVSRVVVALVCLLTLASGAVTGARAEPTADPGFARTGERTDEPVASGAASGTSTWAPDARTPAVVEPYADATNNMRLVQYWDKARMEITNPSGVPDANWHVTTGVLAI